MSDMYDLKRDLNRYYEMKDNIVQVINDLKLSIDKLEPASTKNSDFYNIDGTGVDQNIISKKRDELVAKKDELSGKVLAEINSQIYILRKEIQELEVNPLSASGVL